MRTLLCWPSGRRGRDSDLVGLAVAPELGFEVGERRSRTGVLGVERVLMVGLVALLTVGWAHERDHEMSEAF